MLMVRIKLIIFDMGDIIYDTSYLTEFKSRIDDLLSKNKAKNFNKRIEIWKNSSRGIKTGKKTLRSARIEFLSRLGLKDKFIIDEYESIESACLKKIRPKYKNLRTILLEIIKTGYKTAILSNTAYTKNDLRGILTKLECGDFFDGIFSSHDTHQLKPNKKAYFNVLRFFKVEPSESVFVGHDLLEIEGAKKAGIYTISVKENQEADMVIEDLKNLISAIRTIEN